MAKRKLNRSQVSQTNGSRLSWSSADIKRLIEFIEVDAPLSKVYAAFPNRSPNSIRSKIFKLRKENAELTQALFTRQPWSQEEDQMLTDLVETNEEVNLVELAKTFDRTPKSIQGRIGFLKLRRTDSIILSEAQWAEFDDVGYLQLPSDLWPTQAYDPLKSDAFLVNKSWYKNQLPGVLASVFRGWALAADKAGKQDVKLCIIENETAFNRVLDGSLNQYSKTFNDERALTLLRVSMLGDGTVKIRYDKKGVAYCNYDFVQTLTLQEKNNESHAEYSIEFERLIPDEVKTPFVLTICSGVPYLNPQPNGFKNSWKLRVLLRNLSVLEQLRYENYDQLPGTNQDRTLKRPPALEVFIETFKDKGFALAHLYMQDGSLRPVSQYLSLPHLYCYTTQLDWSESFAYGLYKSTGLKFLVLEGTQLTAREQRARYVLQLCPSCVQDFFMLVKPFIVPCMHYKVVDETSLKKNKRFFTGFSKKCDQEFERWLTVYESRLNLK